MKTRQYAALFVSLVCFVVFASVFTTVMTAYAFAGPEDGGTTVAVDDTTPLDVVLGTIAWSESWGAVPVISTQLAYGLVFSALVLLFLVAKYVLVTRRKRRLAL